MSDQPPNYGIPQSPSPQYGYPPQQQGGYQQPLQPGMPGPLFLEPPNSAMATASLVLGIVGIVGLPLIGSILALIFGYMARNEIRTSQGRVGGQGMATAGIVLGYIGIALGVVIAVFVIGIIAYVATQAPQYLTTPTVGP